MNSKQIFSYTQRDTYIENALKKNIDLIIIGGGITGAGIALDATLRGLKVVLIEKNDFAWGTSSRSTKLIHGGLRYLKQLEFGLVREVGTERAIVHRNARHIVLSEKMLLPIYKNGSLGKMGTSIGLLVYDFLAGVNPNERRKMLKKDFTKKSEPLIDSKGLQGGGMYYEYRTDDARLTIEIIKKAKELGAICLNKTEAHKFIYENDKAKGVRVFDHLKEENYTFNAKQIINASGPWVDLLRKKDKSLEGKRLQLTKGIHIVVKYEKLPIKQAIYFDVADGRMIFAIPRGKITYVGTTDTVYNEDIETPECTKEDVRYLLKAVNKKFPSIQLKVGHIESTWAGLRPLIFEDGKSASELSRKDEIFESESGLLSIAGGKLTGYRKMAERIVDLSIKKMQLPFVSSTSQDVKVAGANFDTSQEVVDLIIRLTGEAKQINLGVEHIKSWVYKYGTNAGEILEIAYNNFRDVGEDPDYLSIYSEAIYCLNCEMVTDLSDFYIRRTGYLYFNRPSIKIYLEEVATLFEDFLGWDKATKKKKVEEFMIEYERVLKFKN